MVTIYLLFVLQLKTRRVHFAVCTATLGDDFRIKSPETGQSPLTGF